MVRGFSGGMMQRISIARAMMHDPEVLFLDEPSPVSTRKRGCCCGRPFASTISAGKTIVLTTHYMDEADTLCERLAIIDHGKIIAQGTPQELKSSIPGGYLLRLRFDSVPDELTAGFASLPGVTRSAPGRPGSGGRICRPRRPVDCGHCHRGAGHGDGAARCPHFGAEPGKPVLTPHRKEFARLNWKTFFAMLPRDGHVARRNLLPMLLQNLLQPMLLTFVFGRILTSSGMMPQQYKNILLPGIMAISMVLAGVQGVAMPLITEFQFTREIEDRLLAPMETAWLAVEKIVAGMIQALVAGLVVIPTAWLVLGSGVSISFAQPLQFAVVCFLVALFSSAGGLALGVSVGQTQIGLMFSLVLAPMMMFGCAYYPWSVLRSSRRCNMPY